MGMWVARQNMEMPLKRQSCPHRKLHNIIQFMPFARQSSRSNSSRLHHCHLCFPCVPLRAGTARTARHGTAQPFGSLGTAQPFPTAGAAQVASGARGGGACCAPCPSTPGDSPAMARGRRGDGDGVRAAAAVASWLPPSPSPSHCLFM